MDSLKYKNIAIIGHMGSGKSVLGKLIAKNLKKKHLDSDYIIEQDQEQSIESIFKLRGESYFREIEQKTILKIELNNCIVLSLGGGSILSSKVRNFLKINFLIVFIDVNISILIERLQKTTKRPLLNDKNIKKILIDLDKKRRKYYLKADLILENAESPKSTLKEFLSNYKKFNE